MKRSQSGFTIVELLIVIVIIAILAAISIVAYNGIQQRARASAAVAALNQSTKAITLWQIDNPDTAPDCDKFKELTNSSGTSCTGTGVTSNTVTYQYSPSATAGAYCITATVGSTSYTVTGTSQPANGGCGGHGVGGARSITNLATNPSFASNVVGWGSAGASISRVTTPWSADGNGALQVTATGQDSYAYINVPAQAGVTYTFMATVRIESAQAGPFQGSGQQRNMFPAFNNSSGTYLSTGGGVSSVPANAPGTYQQRSTGVAPAGTASLTLRLYNGATSGSVYWDQVMIVADTYNGSYADGSSQNQNWIWNGPPNASTSTGSAL